MTPKPSGRGARTTFVGRGTELDTISQLLATSRLVTLTGIGGVGKTRLASEVAELLVGHGFARSWFVGLDSIDDESRVVAVFVRSLGITDQSARPARDTIVDFLADRDALLVVDNCEHVLDAAARLIDELLAELPRLRVIATSRRALEVEGERVFAVPPLGLPSDDSADLGEAERSEAVTLLVDRARAVDPAFAVTAEALPDIVALCRALDGLPLAIELAATRLRSLSVRDVLDRLEHRFSLLGQGPRTATARQRTLRAMVDWSDELCTAEQRRLWSALSVFAGAFTIDAATIVGSGSGIAEHDVPVLLDELVGQSLLTVVADGAARRYRMLETIRAYGRDRALADGSLDGDRRRHLAYYRDMAERTSRHWYGPGQSAALGELRADYAELHAALDFAVQPGNDAATALKLVVDLQFHWAAGGFLGEGRLWVERVLALDGASADERLPALILGAWVALLQGDLITSERWLDEADALAAEPASPERPVPSEQMRASLHQFAGNPAQAAELFGRNIEHARLVGADEETMFPGFQLTIARIQLDDPHAADSAQEVLAIAERLDERWMKSHALWALAVESLVRNQLEDADRLGREAITLQLEFNDYLGSCLMLELLCWVSARRGRLEHAAVLLGAAAAQWRRIGSGIEVFGPFLARLHDEARSIVVAGLAPRRAEARRLEGEELNLHSAIQRALEDEHPIRSVLSAREEEIAESVYRGLSNRQIADELFISQRTVETHVQHILAKLGQTSRIHIAVWYTERAAEPPNP